MLNIQRWLKEQNGDFNKLTEQLAIVTNFHPTDNRVILNYDQLESPKTNEIVRECRGLVLDKSTYELVSRSFYRFFNWSENVSEMKKFQWESCIGYHKEDGSLLSVYYYNGDWHVNTRGSFADGLINDAPITWKELAVKAIGDRFFNEADPNLFYTFELCSLYNKVVRTYNQPKAYLLSTFNREGVELTHDITENIANQHRLLFPTANVFDDIADVEVYLQRCVDEEKTFEGIVIRDQNNIRFKVKSPYYIAFHRAINNHAMTHARILKFVLEGEGDELSVYFPEIAEDIREVQDHVTYWRKDVLDTYKVFSDMKSQKEFALAVKDYEYASVLFEARKTGENPSDIFVKSKDLILKKLERNYGKGKKTCKKQS